MLEKARQFAIDNHGSQRYGSKPYAFHLDWVVLLLESYGEEAQVIGYLHDVVEDTDVTVEQVEQLFNDKIAQAVSILTDQPGATRKERKDKTYHRMAQVTGELEIALIVKTADRLANVLATLENKRLDKFNMYKNEHVQFKSAVYRPGLCEDLWLQLTEAIEQEFESINS